MKPPVPFRTMGFSHSEINYFIVHSVKFTADSDPASHVIACGKWPLIYVNQNYYGKPVEFFCTNLYESNTDTTPVRLKHEQSSAMTKSAVKKFSLPNLDNIFIPLLVRTILFDHNSHVQLYYLIIRLFIY